MAAPDHPASRLRAALSRVARIATQTLTEALRLRLAGLLVVTGGLLLLLALWLRTFNFGAAELKFIGEFGAGTIGLLGTVLAATATAHLYFRDVDGGLAAVVLTRIVGRGEYLAGKLAGVAALLALFVAALGALLGAVLLARGAQLGAGGGSAILFLQAAALAWLKLTLVAAMTLLVCSYASSELFAAGAGLLLAFVAHLRPFTAADGWLAWLRLWPNLGLFDAGALLGGSAPGAGALAGLVLYWGGFLVLFLALTAHVFRRREF